jgi:hypothetical protein
MRGALGWGLAAVAAAGLGLVVLGVGGLGAAGCSDDKLAVVQPGAIRVICTGVDDNAAALVVTVRTPGAPVQMVRSLGVQITTLTVPGLDAGEYEVRVHTVDAAETVLSSVWVEGVVVLNGRTTDVEVDLARGRPPPAEVCDGKDNDHDGLTDEQDEIELCAQCQNNIEVPAADDPRCGNIRCSGLDKTELRGTNTPDSDSKSCVATTHTDITANRCAGLGKCIALPADADRCVPAEQTLAQAGLCQTITGCEGGHPQVVAAANGTPCGGTRTCQAGVCTTPNVPDPGCADGSREGFQDMSRYPGIAACSGGWSVPGVTRDDLVPTCGRASGNDGANKEGTGCSAADLCAAGWHVCKGKGEVAARAPSGCADAVPPGTPDKAYFFAIYQHSEMNTVCTDASGDNDVFGCGNLGVQLQGPKGCDPLTRALASMQAGSCGYNEAEPNLGPWQCQGTGRSDIHEGALVTKKGCPNSSCQYSGQTVSNWDKGGVLCCRD